MYAFSGGSVYRRLIFHEIDRLSSVCILPETIWRWVLDCPVGVCSRYPCGVLAVPVEDRGDGRYSRLVVVSLCNGIVFGCSIVCRHSLACALKLLVLFFSWSTVAARTQVTCLVFFPRSSVVA